MPADSNSTFNTKILVTGGSGLVGSELIKQLLEKNYTVTAIYNSTPITIVHPNLRLLQCDILDTIELEKVMEEITHVYHCAAIVSFDPKDKHHLLKVNVEGTANVVNACIDAGVQKLIHVSSVAALGRIRNGEVVTEEMNWTEETSNSLYGRSKYLGELEVWRGIGEGLQAAIVNPSIILGGNTWETGSVKIFKTAYEEFKWYTDGISGFVSVKDVARAIILLMNSEISGQRFILSAENISYKEIFSSIAKCFGKKPPSKKVTPLMAEVVWRLEAIKTRLTGKKHLLTKETARTGQSVVYFDNSKILKYLDGFTFTSVSLSISDMCAELKETYHLK